MVMETFLRNVPLFSDLPDEDLTHLARGLEQVHLEAGEQLFAQGSPGDKAYVIKEGELEILRDSEGRKVILAVRKAGEVIGEMSLLQAGTRMATVRAKTDALLFTFSLEQLENLLNSSPSAARAMLHTITTRLQATESLLRQSEKIAQLGTLTAGVTHELNNPAAAVQRGAGQLKIGVEKFEQAVRDSSVLQLSDEQTKELQILDENMRKSAGQPDDLDALTRGDIEEEIETWLDGHGIKDAWEHAPALVGMGFSQGKLEALVEHFSLEQLQRILPWLTAKYEMRSLLEEVEQGAKQISEIVKALKSYAYLDQAPVQIIDVHEGLDNTLIILRSKLKEGISLQREYAENLPRIQAYGSELNQVWTNLIDNAIDAMQGKGELVITTRLEGQWVVVQIRDNGPGIPPEIQSKIFDPFFTTKEPGKGIGLGLDISHNIIVQKHHGDIRVTSQPGTTTFEVWLPENIESVAAGEVPVPAIEIASDDVKRKILDGAKNIAVVGISKRDTRPAHSVPAFLQQQGYRIIPIRSTYDEILGEKTYPDLASVPDSVDVVLIFKRSEDVPPVVAEAIGIEAKVVWMQEGIVNEAAAAAARSAGLEVVMDACMRVEYRRLIKNYS